MNFVTMELLNTINEKKQETSENVYTVYRERKSVWK